MKSIQKITRIQLKLNTTEQYVYLGLVSAEPDYKLSLAINKKLKLSLKNLLPLKITDEKGTEVSFSRFSDNRSPAGLIYNLISNRSGKHYLLKKLKNIDYIFQVLNPENEINTVSLTSDLRELETVNAVFNIDMTTFKDKNLQYLTQ